MTSRLSCDGRRKLSLRGWSIGASSLACMVVYWLIARGYFGGIICMCVCVCAMYGVCVYVRAFAMCNRQLVLNFHVHKIHDMCVLYA